MMVQQEAMIGPSTRGEGGGGGGGGGGVSSSGGGEENFTEKAEMERRERIQRYKEERRKQIAARYGTAEWSSSEESGTGEETSYRAYRRKRKGRETQDTSSEQSTLEHLRRNNENGGSPLECRGGGGSVTSRRALGGSSSEDVVLGGVRTNRAARLRHAALNNANNANNNSVISNNNNNNNREHTPNYDGARDRRRGGDLSPDVAAVKKSAHPVDQLGVGGVVVGVSDHTDSALSGSDGRGGRRRRGGGEERDKSHKRKSNLNRATTAEEIPEDVYPLHPSDSNEETPRRRRRRAPPLSPVGGGAAPVLSSEPLKTPDVVRSVVSRITPPASPPTSQLKPAAPQPSPGGSSSQPSSSNSQTTPTTTSAAAAAAASGTWSSGASAASAAQTHHQGLSVCSDLGTAPSGTQSAPSTLDNRNRSCITEWRTIESPKRPSEDAAEGQGGGGEGGGGGGSITTGRKVPPKLAPLRKPEIPEVLRPKDKTGLASPGVVNTPSNSRPSSVVLEKPPVGPESVRPSALRSSLRKPSDTGTCFMAARREKKDDPKLDFLRDLRSKKGDRLSKSDLNIKFESNSGSSSSSTGESSSAAPHSPVALRPTSPSTTAPMAQGSSSTSATNGDTDTVAARLDALTSKAWDTLSKADQIASNSSSNAPSKDDPNPAPSEESLDTVVHECEEYLTVNMAKKKAATLATTTPASGLKSREALVGEGSTGASASAASPSSSSRIPPPPADTGQKNWGGGSEGRSKKGQWLALEEEVSGTASEVRFSRVAQVSILDDDPGSDAASATAVPSGPPHQSAFKGNEENLNSLSDEGVHGILKRRASDEVESPTRDVVPIIRAARFTDEGETTSPEVTLHQEAVRSSEHRSILRQGGPRRCSLDGSDVPRTRSPDLQSILKRRPSGEDMSTLSPDRPATPEHHPSILKRKGSSRASSVDTLDNEPRPILKKRSSIEDLDHFEPKPILKKKSSTDDELDDRPRSILKGGRSREDLDRAEGVISPTPILKRSPRCDSEGEGELRPILKRRDTTDGVRLRLHVSDGEEGADSDSPGTRVRSDSAPESVIHFRGRSSSSGASGITPHGILKRRGTPSPGRFDQMDAELGAILRSRRTQGPDDGDSDGDKTPRRPVSPSLQALSGATGRTPGERPLSVAERIAGMEAARELSPQPRPVSPQRPGARSPGVRPKVRPPSAEGVDTPSDSDRERRRHSAFGFSPDSLRDLDGAVGVGVEAINPAFLQDGAAAASSPSAGGIAEAINPRLGLTTPDSTPDTPSSVSQRAAFFAQLEKEQKSPSEVPVRRVRPSRFSRKERNARCATQPVTEDEVSQAARLADSTNSEGNSSDSVPSNIISASISALSASASASTTSVRKEPPPRSLGRSVGARVALWMRKLEEEQATAPTPPPALEAAAAAAVRRRSWRYKTQPVTMEEVASAMCLGVGKGSSPTDEGLEDTSSWSFRGAREAVALNAAEVLQGLMPGAQRKKPDGRRTSINEPEEDSSHSDSVKGILKRESSRESQRESPRSILKHSGGTSSESRRASYSEADPPRSILKPPESPSVPPVRGPSPVEALRGVLKRDSSLEDPKEIKSILKPESESLEPDHSDSSSDDATLTGKTAATAAAAAASSASSSVSSSVTNHAAEGGGPLVDSLKEIDPVKPKEEKTDTHKYDRKGEGALKSETRKGGAEVSTRKTETRKTESQARKTESQARKTESYKSESRKTESHKSETRKTESHKSETRKTETHKIESHKTESHNLAEALKQVQPIKAKDDLAEALRQIEPINRKEESDAKMTSSVTVSSTTTTSSSESDVKAMKKEAVLRRRTSHNRRQDERRSMVELRTLEQSQSEITTSSQNESESSDSPDGLRFTRLTPNRSSYRGSSGSDMDAAAILGQSPLFRKKFGDTAVGGSSKSDSGTDQKQGDKEATSVGSINARVAALQRSGEDGWKQRVKPDDKDVNSNVTRRKKEGKTAERPVSLMDRVTQLETSSTQWKNRVSASDASKFTVAHKLANAQIRTSASTPSVPYVVSNNNSNNNNNNYNSTQTLTPTGSPLVERKKRSPQPKVFKSKTGGNLPALLGKSSPIASKKDFKRSMSTPVDPDVTPEGPRVAIPRADDETFSAFFSKTLDLQDPEINSSHSSLLQDADFDQISVASSQLLVKRRSVRVQRRQQTTKNPLKVLAARQDIQQEYTEIKMGVGERELKRIKVEELSKSSSLAMEALAGLASKENFSAVALKKVENNPIVREMAPYTHPMLLQVKGRRHAQTRLVQPCASSVNLGDDFLLITAEEIFHYKGEYSNVIERAKASEIALYIIQQKDMGVGANVKGVTEVDENSSLSRKNKFWKHLGGDENSTALPAGPPDEDDHVEMALIAANQVYALHEEERDTLVPVPDAWGQIPKYDLLASDKVLVFDFGTEVYLWAGKKACGMERKVGLALARELWEEPYDYSDCDINPLTPTSPIEDTKLKGNRPDWTLCGKLTENVETILFKEKFIDWPDIAQQTRIKEVRKDMDRRVDPVCELEPCDAKEMLETSPSEPDLVLEMSHLGRGVEYYDEEERRQLCITTNDCKVWHVSEYGKVVLEGPSRLHFHQDDTYVVRWYYHVTYTGRTLKGEPSKHAVTGRDRVAYFFWQGTGSSVSDKGVSALMTVELDEERGPHIRVPMGQEPPAFLAMCGGALVIHKGRHDDEKNKSNWRLYIVRGEYENEAHLLEIDVDSAHLRSRICLILVNTRAGILHLWNGAKALRHTRKVASAAANRFIENKAPESGWQAGTSPRIKEQFEGAESRDFWEGFGGMKNKNRHFSLLDDDHTYDWTPRMWHLAATPLSFKATEVLCAYRATDLPNPMPFVQNDLYLAPQPALFLVDGGHRVWVWQGYWPEEAGENEDPISTGSALLRFNFARRAALQTALNYCRLKAEAQKKAKASKIRSPKMEVDMVEPQLIVAGFEPLEFTNLFPTWTEHPDVTTAQEKEGRWERSSQYLVKDVLAQLCRTHYSLKELQARPLPDGVDPLRLEVYLNDEEFQLALGMDRNEFYGLQQWKQIDMKKKATLF